MGHGGKIEGHEKECDDLQNQGSERDGGGFVGSEGKALDLEERAELRKREERAFLPGGMERGKGYEWK